METRIINKVLIIDNEFKEALPIMQAMAQKGVYSIYWNGKEATQPEKPLKGVRLVILDIRFSAIVDERGITSNLFNLLKRSVSIDNGPFVLCMWSKHNGAYLSVFKEDLVKQSDVPQPYLIIELDKSEFMYIEKADDTSHNEFIKELKFLTDNDKVKVLEVSKNYIYDEEEVSLKESAIDNLLAKLEGELNKINSLITLMIWEKMASDSATSLINSISSLSESSEDWDTNIKTLIQYLAKAYGGESLGKEASPKDYIINALSSINNMFPDELWSQLNNLNISEEDFTFIKEPVIYYKYESSIYTLFYSAKKKNFELKKDNSEVYATFKNKETIDDIEKTDRQKAEICTILFRKFQNFMGYSNFKLLCEPNQNTTTKKPGNIYTFKDDNLLEEIANHILKTNKGKTQYFMHNEPKNLEKDIKIEQLDEKAINLVKLDISSSCDYAQSKLKRVRILSGLMIDSKYYSKIEESKDIYCTPEIKVNDKNVKFVFNFHYLIHESQANLDKHSKLLSFRDIFLNEIKHDLSNYISRVGIIRL